METYEEAVEGSKLRVGSRSGAMVKQRPMPPAENPLSKYARRLAMWDRLGFSVRLAWRDICTGR